MSERVISNSLKVVIRHKNQYVHSFDGERLVVVFVDNLEDAHVFPNAFKASVFIMNHSNCGYGLISKSSIIVPV